MIFTMDLGFSAIFTSQWGSSLLSVILSVLLEILITYTLVGGYNFKRYGITNKTFRIEKEKEKHKT